MSVLIKGMEMPSCCLMCPMYAISGCRVSKRIFPDWMNVATVPEGCPLIPIPEGHGRLIDADAFCRFVANNSRIDGIIAAGIISYINAAQTIVPAEGGDEDG